MKHLLLIYGLIFFAGCIVPIHNTKIKRCFLLDVPWATNQALQQQIKAAFNQRLTQSQTQEFMEVIKDLNTISQNWTPTQMSALSPVNAEIVIEQAKAQNSTKQPFNVVFCKEVRQTIIDKTKKYIPNVTRDEIQELIKVLEKLSTLSIKYLPSDQLTGLAGFVAQLFVQNTLANESTTCSTTINIQSHSEEN